MHCFIRYRADLLCIKHTHVFDISILILKLCFGTTLIPYNLTQACLTQVTQACLTDLSNKWCQ